MAATIGQKHKNGFKIVEIWDNHSESLKNNLYNDFKGPELLLGGMNLENEIDTCQTTVLWLFENCRNLDRFPTTSNVSVVFQQRFSAVFLQIFDHFTAVLVM